METRGLMPRQGRDDYSGSRDYHLPTIPCARTICRNNVGGKCGMPSAMELDGKGVCATGQRPDMMKDITELCGPPKSQTKGKVGSKPKREGD